MNEYGRKTGGSGKFFGKQQTPLYVLSILGLQNTSTTTDGNCAFESIMNSLEEKHTIDGLRTITVRQMREHREDYISFYLESSTEVITYDDHCDDILAGPESCGTRAWADHIPLQALSDALQINLVIIDTNASVVAYFDKDKERRKAPVFILFHEVRAHYESVSVLPNKKPYEILDGLVGTPSPRQQDGP